jgi:hypothetical protein
MQENGFREKLCGLFRFRSEREKRAFTCGWLPAGFLLLTASRNLSRNGCHRRFSGPAMHAKHIYLQRFMR